MKKEDIFIASSINDLGDDRLYLHGDLGEINKEYVCSGKDIYFRFVFCEDAGGEVKYDGSQEELNERIKASAVTVVIFNEKVGKYTVEELEIALETQKNTGRPFVFLYFKKNAECDPVGKKNVLEIAQKYGLEPREYSEPAEIKDAVFQKLRYDHQ